MEVVEEEVAGSALRALALKPHFNHYVFIEKNPDFHSALEALLKKYNVPTTCLLGEANAKLRELIQDDQWTGRRASNRGVVFLDPFALHVEWSTLEALASTRALDVWYLFPLRDVTRQLAKSSKGIGPKASRLDTVLGSAWSVDLYKFPTIEDIEQCTLFPAQDELAGERIGDKSHIERWFKSRLQTIFPFVSEPLPLFTDPTRQAFSLFLAISNPNKAAVDLGSKFWSHVKKHFVAASPRKRAR